ncbi:hypothetical protein ACFSSA_15025 [Luteolibacter algae]|uniref:PepSY domain-containing protein n=1 Tax=Luteolibacter algae TaxID=454151 RepID=A0ABW5DEC3_9BACT
MKKIVRKLHRYLGLIFSISILMSSGSGVIHVLMSRTQSAPPAAKPSGALLDTSAITVTPADAFPDAPPAAINIRNIAGKPHYQAFIPGQREFTYIDATNGRKNPDADATYAREIASTFLGTDEIEQTDFLTSFNSEYIGIFRILPVYRFDLADGKGTRVYVSTVTGSVTRHTDDEKQFEASVFTNFHKLGFIPNKDARDWLLTILTGAAFLISILGIVLFFLTRPRKNKKPATGTTRP